MIVRVLGSAAGGGVPQWNCACENCTAARTGMAPRRTQSSIAISSDGEQWILVNCSPDIAQQIEAFAPLQPRQTRGTPIAGMLFTDANVDHLGGLAVLRQAGPHHFTLHSSQIVREIAASQPAFSPFTQPPHRWVDVKPDDEYECPGLLLRAFDVPGTTPGYAERKSVSGAVVAFEVRERSSDRTVLAAPVFSEMNAQLERAIARAAIAFLDGSFFYDDEMQRQGLSDKTARHLGHLPVGGEGGTLARLRNSSAQRIVFTHLNNSNPMLDHASPEAALVRDTGAEVAFDGFEAAI